MKRLGGLTLGMLLLATVSAPAFVTAVNTSGNTRRWNLITPQSGISTNVVNTNTHAVRFYLASDAYSAANATTELNAIRAAFAQWQSISNTFVKFEEAGLVAPPVDVNTSDASNIVYWTKSSTLVNGGLSDIGGALGVTFISAGSTDNIIRQADIVFNGVNYAWFADYFSGNTTDTFVEGVALHEIGHFIGIQHSPVGAATMMWVTGDGVSLQSGLSTDDLAAARYLYPLNLTNYGAIKGAVTKSGSPVFGAAVFARDAASNIVAGAVSDTAGNYLLAALPPGNYQIRAAPLDEASASDWLIKGVNIINNATYNTVDTAFLPTSYTAASVTVNATNTLNLSVIAGTPAFRITHIRAATANAGSYSWSALPDSLRAGQSNYTIGVASATLPTSTASFSISGDGLTLGSPSYLANAFGSGLNFISIPISVSSNATPGMRDFIVTQGGNVAYANGFFEVRPTVTDFNRDGLDDDFQRTYFPVFTAAEAAPGVDPDADGMNNSAERIAGTVPTNSVSVLKLSTVTRTNNTATIRWLSVSGKRYQVGYTTNLNTGSWVNLGSPITASGTNTTASDTTATNIFRYYRVQVLP
jgi:hypothetical protein